jgi:hypothetical protein
MEGVVRDATGEALPGVTITLPHLGIGISRSYRTSFQGRFTGALLTVGNYKLNQPLHVLAVSARTLTSLSARSHISKSKRPGDQGRLP